MVNKACYFYDYNITDRCIIKNSEIQCCDNPCAYYEVVSASPLFLNKMDTLHRNASRVKKEEGFDDIVIHSTALYFVSKNADGDEVNISSEEFAKIVQAWYKNDVPNIRLIACSSGAFPDGAAQQLSNILGVKVKAPLGPVVVDFDGNMHVEDAITGVILNEKSAWRIFEPKMKGENNNDK